MDLSEDSRRHSRLIGELRSSLGASSLENLSAVSSGHSFSEAMLHLSLSLLGLICSFHERHLLYSFRWLRVQFLHIPRVFIQRLLYYTRKIPICQEVFSFFCPLFLLFYKKSMIILKSEQKILIFQFLCNAFVVIGRQGGALRCFSCDF